MQATRPSAATMIPPALSARPPARILDKPEPSYLAPAAATGTSRSVVFEQSLPLPAAAPIRPMLADPGGLYVPAVDRIPAMEVTMVEDRFSASGGPAAADRSAALAAIQVRPSPYSPYSGPVNLPPTLLPGTSPNEATPFITKDFFPKRLFGVLSSGEHAHIISWQPNGKGFMIHDKPRFAAMVLPWHFKGVKFSSFVRRLSRWKFARVPRGPERGAYYHEHFVRNRPDLLLKMFCPEDGQFEEGKRKGKGNKGSETEELDGHIGKQEGEKTQGTLPKNEDKLNSGHKPWVQTPSPPARVKSPESTPGDIPSPEGTATKISGPGGKEQLPSIITKSPQANKDIAAALEKIRRFVASPDEIFLKHPVDTQLQMEYPTPESQTVFNERRTKEIQRKLPLSPSMLICNNAPSAAPRTVDPTHILRLRSGLISNQAPYAADPITGQRMLPVTCAGLATTAPGAYGTGNSLEDPRMIREALAGGVGGGGLQAVMMSQEERDEFAEYLMLKRKRAAAFHHPF